MVKRTDHTWPHKIIQVESSCCLFIHYEFTLCLNCNSPLRNHGYEFQGYSPPELFSKHILHTCDCIYLVSCSVLLCGFQLSDPKQSPVTLQSWLILNVKTALHSFECSPLGHGITSVLLHCRIKFANVFVMNICICVHREHWALSFIFVHVYLVLISRLWCYDIYTKLTNISFYKLKKFSLTCLRKLFSEIIPHEFFFETVREVFQRDSLGDSFLWDNAFNLSK